MAKKKKNTDDISIDIDDTNEMSMEFVDDKKKKKKSRKKEPEYEVKEEVEKPVVEEVEEKVEEKIEEKKIEEDNNTTSVSVIDTHELNSLIEEDLGIKKEPKKKKHILVHFFLIILLFVSLASFGITILDNNSTITSLINNSILTLFTILFVVISITYNRKSKSLIFFSGLLLLGYFLLGINNNFNVFSSPIATTPDFQGKSLVDVMKWASKNNITVNQEYEYSDMVKEYDVISQNVKEGTKLGDIKDLTVSVSEGPNPYKEIIVPSMIGWDDERVIKFVLDNYLSNVQVEFVASEKAQDTVIEQSTSGTLKRNDQINLTFSYGEELGFSEVKLIDFTNKSKFETEFYLKQHQLNYSFGHEYSDKIKKGYAVSQNIDAGEMVPINSTEVVVNLSYGPKIKVPELKNMSLEDITKWAIEKKIKLDFSDQYDDTIKENNIISANYSKGDIIKQGDVVKVLISRGALKMPKFKSLNDFYTWANKYNVRYEEKHEFSDSVKAGEIIEFSYKTGDSIKNNETIIVTISDGKKREVPNLIGLTKREAISKLEKADLSYNFIYRNNKASKDKVIGQSIKAGSEISSGTTVTVTLSSGVEDDEEEIVERKTNNNTNNNGNNSNNNNNNNNNHTPTPTPTPTCNSCTITGLKNVIRNNMDSGYQATANAVINSIKSQCPGIKVNVSGDTTSGKAAGSFVSGFSGGSTDSCSTVSIVLAK